MLDVINPATGRKIASYTELDVAQVDTLIERCQQAQIPWAAKTYTQRAQVLNNVAATLRKNKQNLGQLMTDEMGKPVKEAGPEVEKAAWAAEHYAQFAESYLADDVLESDASKSYVSYQPLGTLLGIFPWNAPLWIAFRYLAPALMAGNTCVLKHDPHVPGCAEGIMQAFKDAGAPDDIVVNLAIKTGEVAHAIEHPAIQAISFTGSSRAGAIVASLGAAQVKHSVLELGGSDPFIVLEDANLDKAADVAVLSRMINAGQSCIAAKRIIVQRPVYRDFIEKLKSRLSALNVGDPNDAKTDVGPIARADLREGLHRQVELTIEAGAKCEMGGKLPQGPGFYYPVTLLTDVPKGSCAMQEETFGPLMVVSVVDTIEEAIELANDTQYGLGAGVWSENSTTALSIANQIQAGQVAINGIVKTDPRLPSGGIKRSGIGRELGPQGIHEFVNAKQIWIA